MSKILVFGTVLFDHIGEQYYIGGCHTNVAAHCARLGMDTTMVSCVGQDDLGEFARRWLTDIGVRTDFIMTDTQHGTGTVEVDISEPQNPKYVFSEDSACDYIHLSEENMRRLLESEYDYLYYGTFEQRHSNHINTDTLFDIIQGLKGKKCFCDINIREGCYTIPKIVKSLKAADILKMNEEELYFLSEQILKIPYNEKTVIRGLMKQFSIDIIIVTRSSKGASAYCGEQRVDVEAVPVEVMDSVGAGDAFSAAFLKYYGESGSIERALKAGAVLGSYVAGQRAAVPEYEERLLAELKNI